MTIDNKEIKIFDGTYEQFKQAEKPIRNIKEDKNFYLRQKLQKYSVD